MSQHAASPNLLQGIQLVQAGRHAEALAYLRHAARTEPLTADGWLWLAAATPDLAEYRNCVNQALRLDPTHRIALRMRDDLVRLDHAAYPIHGAYGSPAAPAAPPYTGGIPDYILSPDEFATLREDGDNTATRVKRPSRLRRVLRIVALVVLLGSCGGIFASVIASGVIQGMVHDWLTSGGTQTLDFTVSESPAYRFRVTLPESWLPANTDYPTWRDTRDDLIAQFPPAAGQEPIWEQLDESFSTAVRDPVYGEMLPAIRLIETDPAILAEHGVIASLTLEAILPYPNTTPASAPAVCDRMRGLEAAYHADQLTLPPGGTEIETTLAVRQTTDDCIFAIQRQYTLPASFTPVLVPGHTANSVRYIWIAVPVEDERYANWILILSESHYQVDETLVEDILRSLTHQS